MGVLPSIVVCAAIAAASPQHNYVKYANSFCVGNFNNKSTFFQSSQNESECQAKCEETNCRCFDHKPAAHQKAAECRLTNGTGIQASSENFDAYVDASSPLYAAMLTRPCSPGADVELVIEGTDTDTSPKPCWRSIKAPGMSATWNLSAIQHQGAVFATEARSIFNQGHLTGSTFSCPGSVVLWGPTINLNRDPRWGRNGETASEDPLFNSMYGAAYAEGAQRSPEAPHLLKTIVTLKHWGVYSVDRYKNATSEYHRESFDANVSMWDFFDSYAPTFEKAITGAMDAGTGKPLMGAKGVMCSYNSVNGVPSCASRWMQTEILRGNWSYDGYVVGDSDTVQYINTAHHYVNNPAAAVQAALHAGTDIESWTLGGGLDYYRDVIPTMIRNGTLNVSLVDLALTRLLTLRFKTGLFEPNASQQPFFKIGPNDRGTAAFAEDSLDAARQSMTLLVNKGSDDAATAHTSRTASNKSAVNEIDSHFHAGGGSSETLPIHAGSKIAIIGPYRNHGGASKGVDSELKRLNHGGETQSVQGCGINGNDKSGFGAALAAAAIADVVVLALGTDPSLEHESMDRLQVTLPAIQSELALAVMDANKRLLSNSGVRSTAAKIVLVLVNYGEISTEELLSIPGTEDSFPLGGGGSGGSSGGVDGLLMAFMPPTGTPIAEALMGSVNVGGKLPYTIYPNNYTDEVGFTDMSLNAGPGRGYRYYKGTPLFPFGYGLSYTSFKLAMAGLMTAPASSKQPSRQTQQYTVTVSNTGARVGTETVQLYFVPPATLGLSSWAAPLPRRRLIDWRKVEVEPGKAVDVTFNVTADQLKLVDTAGNKVQVPGLFTLLFTNGAAQTVTAPFHV